MSVNIEYLTGIAACNPDDVGVLVVGKHEHLKQLNTDVLLPKFGQKFNAQHFKDGVAKLSEKSNDSVDVWFKSFTIATLPCNASRHNAPMFPHTLSQIIASKFPRNKKETVVIVCERDSLLALGLAASKVFPLYNQKTSGSSITSLNLSVEFVIVDGPALTSDEAELLNIASQSVRLAAMIVDTPCNIMHTNAFLEEIRAVGKDLGITPVVIQGEELNERGFGGIYGVGKAAINQPALAVLSYKPENATKTIAWCGKGIVYDTGGLSIKGKTFMPGMKGDCGGAAGILGAFRAAVKLGFKENLHAVFCLAENAVGPLATRPDDVHTLYSGLTVEINNTDAEGRLVLGDGVAYAKKDLAADVIVDMATLTGAQGISTGKYHAAIITNKEDWEISCVKAGRISGDLTHPLPYAPEMHFEDQFHSVVADMKNSVKDRANAQSSCAGLFIGSHIGFDFPGVWLHIDMAGPSSLNERATGYGVGLLLTLFGKYTKHDFLNRIGADV